MYANPFEVPLAASRRENGLEKQFRLALQRAGLRFIPQYQVGRYRLDFFLPDLTIGCEVQGNGWHFKSKDQATSLWGQRRFAKDERKRRLVTDAGITLMYFWEKDVRSDVDGCIARLLTARPA